MPAPIITNYTSLAQAQANGHPNATATPQYGAMGGQGYIGAYNANNGVPNYQQAPVQYTTPPNYSSTSPAYNLGGPVDFTQYLAQMGGPQWSETQSGFNDLRGKADQLYDSSGYMNESKALSDMLMSQGVNAANAAGAQYRNAAMRSGTSGAGAGVARALSLIPAQTEARKLALGSQEFHSSQEAQKAAYLANLQSQYASNQQNYRSMLAGYNANILGINNSSAQWQAGLAQNQRQLDSSNAQWQAQLAQNQRQFDTLNPAPSPFAAVPQYQGAPNYAAAPPYAPQTAQPRQVAPPVTPGLPGGNYVGNTAFSANPRLMTGVGTRDMNWNMGNASFMPGFNRNSNPYTPKPINPKGAFPQPPPMQQPVSVYGLQRT